MRDTGSLAGKTLADVSSGSPEEANEAAAWARSHGLDYLGGAVMTTPPGRQPLDSLALGLTGHR